MENNNITKVNNVITLLIILYSVLVCLLFAVLQ